MDSHKISIHVATILNIQNLALYISNAQIPAAAAASRTFRRFPVSSLSPYTYRYSPNPVIICSSTSAPDVNHMAITYIPSSNS